MQRTLITLALLLVSLAGCSGGGSGDKASTVTGPTTPTVVVTCQDVTGQNTGNTTFIVNVDCGSRDSGNVTNPPPEPKAGP